MIFSQEFCPTLPPTRSKDTVDLSWIVDVLNTLFQGGHRVAVLCEYGIRRSTAVAVAYLHLAKGVCVCRCVSVPVWVVTMPMSPEHREWGPEHENPGHQRY